MPLFMDVHENLPGAHRRRRRRRPQEGRRGPGPVRRASTCRYWVDETNGKVFCLVDAPDAGAAETVHKEAHGLLADRLYPVVEGS